MNKKLVIAIVAIVLVAALAIFGLPLYSQLYYHRSQAATVFAWQLDEEAYTTEEEFQGLLLQKAADNRGPYLIPPEVVFSVDVDMGIHDSGMQYFVLNEQETPDKLLFYFAGGSYTDQPRAVHFQFLNALAENTGAMIVLPVYPKIPGANAEKSYETVLEFYGDYMAEQNCGTLYFMGDSAGGGMALSLAMQLRDAGMVGPDELILICPWVDVTMSNPDIADYEKKDTALDAAQLARLGELWTGDLSPTDPVVSPLYGTFENLGTIHLITSKGELLYPDIMLLSGKLDAAVIDHELVVSPGMFHVWPLYLMYNIPEVQETCWDIVDMVNNYAE